MVHVHNCCYSKKQIGRTALRCAAYKGHTAIVLALVEAGADTNIQSNVRLYIYVSRHMQQICLYEISLNICLILLDCI